ncbi:MAG: 50S ribosomal protein L25 [Bacteroidetes bacterium]|nr:50S ribosomal protein L25 [Bacteroidota bacterium]
MKSVTINGSIRKEVGKKAAKAVRREEKIPCVVYGGDQVKHFSTDFNSVRALIYTPEFKLAEINLDGETYRCIVKDVQFHPVTDKIVHIDFLNLVDGYAAKIQIPIHFKGVSPGVTMGGVLSQKLRHITIKTTPENIMDEFLLDISNLEIGQSIRVRDIELDESFQILNPPGMPIATVNVPRALVTVGDEGEEEEEELDETPATEDAE